MRRAAATGVALAMLAGVGPAAAAETLAPFKDALFTYPAELSSRDGGDYRVLDYREYRDIDERDAVPERRVKDEYVALGVRRVERDLALETPQGRLTHVAVGREKDARAITVYLHGQGGSRRQGVDDFTFGGNFNRIKNLMAANDGLYLSPDFSDFRARGMAEVAAILAHYLAASPAARVFVACGSMGGALCFRLADDKAVAPRLSGLLLLGSYPDDGFLKSRAFRARVPLLLAQGSRDKVFAVEKQEAFYTRIRAAAPGYPVRFLRFEGGTHGTPIRMVDWRAALNWMLSLQ